MIQKNVYNKKTLLLLNLILMELLLAVISNSFIFFLKEGLWGVSVNFILKANLIMGFFMTVISLMLVGEIMRLADKEQEAHINKLLLEESRETIDLLRTHKHDFLNHLQILHGMMQLKRHEDAVNFLNGIIGDLQTNVTVNNINNPVLAALILKKTSMAEKNKVRMEVDVQSQMENLLISPTDLSRIIGNLVDNAIYAAKEVREEDERIVCLTLFEDENWYKIAVSNTGAPIPDELKKKVFEKGFTTKGSDGSGLGLFIVKSLVEKNKGRIELRSDEDIGTNFLVSLPK